MYKFVVFLNLMKGGDFMGIEAYIAAKEAVIRQIAAKPEALARVNDPRFPKRKNIIPSGTLIKDGISDPITRALEEMSMAGGRGRF